MPVVTEIKHQKRSAGRFNVYVDGAYAFSLSDLELGTSGLRVGHELSHEEVARYQVQAAADGGYVLALRYVAIRPRSRREVEEYLARKGVREEVRETVMRRLMQAGLANDQAFAASWVASRQLLRPRSRRRLEQELAAKGVSREDAEAALGALDGEQELAALVEVVEKKRRLSQYREPTKLMAYLARQGYPYELIKKALQVVSERSDE